MPIKEWTSTFPLWKKIKAGSQEIWKLSLPSPLRPGHIYVRKATCVHTRSSALLNIFLADLIIAGSSPSWPLLLGAPPGLAAPWSSVMWSTLPMIHTSGVVRSMYYMLKIIHGSVLPQCTWITNHCIISTKGSNENVCAHIICCMLNINNSRCLH